MKNNQTKIEDLRKLVSIKALERYQNKKKNKHDERKKDLSRFGFPVIHKIGTKQRTD